MNNFYMHHKYCVSIYSMRCPKIQGTPTLEICCVKKKDIA